MKILIKALTHFLTRNLETSRVLNNLPYKITNSLMKILIIVQLLENLPFNLIF